MKRKQELNKPSGLQANSHAYRDEGEMLVEYLSGEGKGGKGGLIVVCNVYF